jgi:nitrogen-specific signal transduction histidine kinase
MTSDPVLETLLHSPNESEKSKTTTESLRELIHELRQPLSTIEAIAYLVEMRLPEGQTKPRQQMRRLQKLVCKANAMLKRANSEFKPQD